MNTSGMGAQACDTMYVYGQVGLGGSARLTGGPPYAKNFLENSCLTGVFEATASKIEASSGICRDCEWFSVCPITLTAASKDFSSMDCPLSPVLVE